MERRNWNDETRCDISGLMLDSLGSGSPRYKFHLMRESRKSTGAMKDVRRLVMRDAEDSCC